MERKFVIRLFVYLECENITLSDENQTVHEHIQKKQYLKPSEIKKAKEEMERLYLIKKLTPRHWFVENEMDYSVVQPRYVEKSINNSPISITNMGLEEYEELKRLYLYEYGKLQSEFVSSVKQLIRKLWNQH